MWAAAPFSAPFCFFQLSGDEDYGVFGRSHRVLTQPLKQLLSLQLSTAVSRSPNRRKTFEPTVLLPVPVQMP